MPDRKYDTLKEAISEAPTRPSASIWETVLTGSGGERLAEIKRAIAEGGDAKLQIQIFSSPDTLRSAGLQGRDDLDGVEIVEGGTKTFDLVRFKFCR